MWLNFGVVFRIYWNLVIMFLKFNMVFMFFFSFIGVGVVEGKNGRRFEVICRE